jgi:hypothetical protein|tara:strand:- start:396 stop:635 length:240 start_codon:yes stop_codon:yes gene_type:complete
MNKCIKRTSGGVMRISDYWLLEVVQQCQWVLKETNSNHSQNYRSKKILDRIRKYLNQVGRGKEFRQNLQEQNNRGVLPL